MSKKDQQSCFVVDIQNRDLFHAPLMPPEVSLLEHWACAVLQHENLQEAELTLRLVDAVEMQALNQRYRGKNVPTNVLSFPAHIPDAVDLELPFLGDIILCVPVIQQEAAEQAKPQIAHWAHMVVHGILHLLNYDHIDAEEAMMMEAKEIFILEQLHFADPYMNEDYNEDED
jgi:probable rRNA maturation factor